MTAEQSFAYLSGAAVALWTTPPGWPVIVGGLAWAHLRRQVAS